MLTTIVRRAVVQDLSPRSGRMQPSVCLLLPAVQGNQQPGGPTGVSEALALALRARQQAEWGMDEEDSRS